MIREKMLKIGMVLDKKFPPDNRVEKEALTLSEIGYQVYILCIGQIFSFTPIERYKGIKIVRIPTFFSAIDKMRALSNTIFNLYPYYWSFYIRKFVENFKIDVLHIHDLYMFPAGFRARRYFSRYIPIVGDLHENYVHALKHYRFSSTFPGSLLIDIQHWIRSEQVWIHQLDYVITVIEEMKERINRFQQNDKIYVVDNSVNISEFTRYNKSKTIFQKFKGKFVLSYIGGIDYHRGINTLIKSLEFLDDLSEIVLCIVGKSKNEDFLFKQVHAEKIRHRIFFEGYKPFGILQNYFEVSDIGVIPHLKSVQTDNSSPNKLYQYMVFGTPVIASNCRSIQSILEQTHSGLIFNSGDSEDLARKIRYLYENPVKRQQLGKNAQKAIYSKYNWERNRNSLSELYQNIENTLNKNSDRYNN